MYAQPAYALQQKGHYRKALKIFDGLLRRYPQLPEVFNDRGVMETLLGYSTKAAHDFKHAIKINKTYLPAYLSLGYLYTKEGRLQLARAVYARALENRPHTPPDKKLLILIRREQEALKLDRRSRFK